MFPLLHQGSSSDFLNAHREDEKWEEWGFLDDLRVKHQTSSRGILLYMDVFKKTYPCCTFTCEAVNSHSLHTVDGKSATCSVKHDHPVCDESSYHN